MSCFDMMVWLVLLIGKTAGAAMHMRPAGNVLTAVMGVFCDVRVV